MRILFECPYRDCGINPDLITEGAKAPANIDLNSPRVKMVTCDEEAGGCGRRFVVWVDEVKFEKHTQTLDSEVKP